MNRRSFLLCAAAALVPVTPLHWTERLGDGKDWTQCMIHNDKAYWVPSMLEFSGTPGTPREVRALFS